jgi:hypothetical protein
MKQKILFLSLIAFSFVISFTACKKESSTNDDSTEISSQSDDQSRFSSETDAVSNDAEFALESSPALSARPGGNQDLICDATVEIDSLSDPRTITITYDGTNCLGNRKREGVVVVSMAAGIQWKDAGAAITVHYQDLKITRLSDNKSITINGEHTITNVSGGLLYELANVNEIVHTITSSGISVKFDNGTSRSWQVARRRVFTWNSGIVITTTGTHTEGNVTNITEWGTNRLGNTFTTSIVTPLVVRQDCSFRLVSGSVMHSVGGLEAVATFGLNSSGIPTDCPGVGSYYFKLVWTFNGTVRTVILPY